MVRVKLKDIVDCLEMADENWEQFLNTETGEVVSLSNGLYEEADEELAMKIDNSRSYVRLPNQYDIHEWQIMENFALDIPNRSIREQLLNSLHGNKAFRRFKDAIERLGITEDYYEYLNDTYYKIAEDWCRDNKIPYGHL